jgi:hypothetical protein
MTWNYLKARMLLKNIQYCQNHSKYLHDEWVKNLMQKQQYQKELQKTLNKLDIDEFIKFGEKTGYLDARPERRTSRKKPRMDN